MASEITTNSTDRNEAGANTVAEPVPMTEEQKFFFDFEWLDPRSVRIIGERNRRDEGRGVRRGETELPGKAPGPPRSSRHRGRLERNS